MKLSIFLTRLLFSVPLICSAEDIAISTDSMAMVVRIDQGNNPRVIHFGKRLENPGEYSKLPDQTRITEDYTGLYNSAYTPAGSRNLLEPAIQVTHADGNPSLDLRYLRHEITTEGEAVTTEIHLKDPVYPFEVTLYYKAYPNEDII